MVSNKNGLYQEGKYKERGLRPSEVKGLRFAPIPSGLSPLTSFTPILKKQMGISGSKPGPGL
jgi:hypothetical protein